MIATEEEIKAEGFVNSTLIARLMELRGTLIDIEFECGSIVKKALGGRLIRVGKDFIELVQVTGFIRVLLFIPELADPVEERVLRIIIPIKKICSVEFPLPDLNGS